MLSSGEISQMFAAQNQMFMGQAAFAQQIGIAPPTMHLGAMAPPPSMGGGFNYAPSAGMFGPGYGGGNRFASSAMSMGGAIAGMGATLALDPVSAFLRGSGGLGALARAPMAGIMGGMAAALPMAAVGALASHSIQSVVHGGQQQAAINSSLGQNYNFFNPASRTGMGFTRDDAQAIGSTVRQLSHVPEMMSSMSELTSIMGKLKTTGIMQGVRDATEFSRRFKEAVTTIRDTARILGTTMDEATQFFQHSRNAGFLGRSDQLKNALNVQLTSGLTGMNNGQVMALQSAGADLATQVGARRGLGASAVTSIAQSIGKAQSTGAIRDGLIQDITGMDGAEGVQAVSQQMAGVMMRMSQSAPGRLMMAGLAKFDDSGRAVGLDDDLVRQFNAGRISMSELKSRAGNLTNAQKISFRAREADLGMSFAGQVGPGGMSRFINEVTGGKFGSEGSNLIMQRYGATAGVADLMSGMQNSRIGDDFQAMSGIRGREADIRERTDPEAIMKRIKTKLHSATFGHMEELGSKIHGELGKAYDDFIDDLVGRHVMTLSKEGAQAFSKAMSGGSKKELMEMFNAAHGLKTGGDAGLSVGGGMLGGAIGGSLGGLMMGPLGMMGMGAGAALGANHRKLGGMLANSGIMDAISGTRSDKNQELFMARMTGSKNPTELVKGLLRLNQGKGSQAMVGAGGLLDEMKGGIDGFGDMDDAHKLDALRTELSNQTSGINGVLLGQFGIDIGNDFSKLTDDHIAKLAKFNPKMAQLAKGMRDASKMGGDAMTNLISAGQGSFGNRRSQIDFTKAARPGAVADSMSAEAIASAKRTAFSDLSSTGLSDTTVGVIRDDKNMREVLTKGIRDPAIARALDSNDPAVVAKNLSDLGYTISPDKVKVLQQAFDDMKKHNPGTKMLTALNNLGKAEKAEGGRMILDTLNGLGAEAVKGSMSLEGDNAKMVRELGIALSGVDSATDKGAAFDAARSKMVEVSKALSKIKDPNERKKVIAALGRSGASVEELSRLQGLRGKTFKNKEELARSLGLDPTDSSVMGSLADAGAVGSGSIKLTDSMMDKLEGSVGGLAIADASARTGKTNAGPEDRLLTVLEKIDKNQDMLTTVLISTSGMSVEEINKKAAEMRGKIKTDGSDAKKE